MKKTGPKYKLGEYRVRLVRESTVLVNGREGGDSHACAVILHTLLDDSLVERIYALYLNGKNKVIGAEQLAQGSLHGCSLQAQDVFRGALIAGATSVVLGHNHPSGDPTPSQEDIDLTLHVIRAGEVLGTTLVDHIIVSPNGKSSSFHELGLMSKMKEKGFKVPLLKLKKPEN